MKAFVVDKYKAPLQLAEVAEPVVGDHDVLVEVRAAGLNQLDEKIRAVGPERVIAFEDGGKKAFVEIPGADPKQEPKRIEIKLGISDGMNAEVLSGLQKGSKVVERPPKKIS